LRNALLARRPRPVLDDPRGQPLPDQPQDPPIRDPVLKELLQPLMVKAGEELAEIRVEHPVHAPLEDPERKRIQRVMRAAPRPKPIGEPDEVLLVDRVQHLDERPLEDLVLKRSDTERPQPPVRLRDEHSPRRLRPVAPAMNPGMQIPKLRFEIVPVVLPRDAVHPRRGRGLQRPIGRSQAVDVNVMQERREPRFLVRSCRSAHAIQLAWRALPGPVSGARFAGRVPLGRSASLHHLRRPALGVVRQLRRYYRIV